ncbi:MAG: hypothetical protein AAF329_01160 [Cyanobacteria bacterium P01_A01_bin.17]
MHLLEVPSPVKRSSFVTGQLRTIPVGLAVGNHAIKLSTDQQRSVIRSQSLPYHPDLLTGSGTLLLGEALKTPIFMGRLAVGDGLDTYNGVQTLAHGLKGELYARYALLAIAHSIPDGATINLAVSLPTSQMQSLIEPLLTTHELLINGQRKTFRITTIRFQPEGLGAATRLRQLKLQRSTQPVPSFAALDFGGGNCSIVGLDADGAVAGFAQTTPGVLALYSDIASAIAARQGGIAPTDDAVRLGVELGTFKLSGYGETDFRDLYDAALPQWLQSRLSEIRAKAGAILDRAAVKVVCGGGANLPGLMAQLPDGYAKTSNPQQLESEGLLEFARRIDDEEFAV